MKEHGCAGPQVNVTGIKRLLADAISANGFSFTDGQEKELGTEPMQPIPLLVSLMQSY